MIIDGMTNEKAIPPSAAVKGVAADDGVLHPGGRQVVFDHVVKRLENLEAVPPTGSCPERDDGFSWGTTGKAACQLGDQHGIIGCERETLARPCLNPSDGIEIGATTVRFHQRGAAGTLVRTQSRL